MFFNLDGKEMLNKKEEIDFWGFLVFGFVNKVWVRYCVIYFMINLRVYTYMYIYIIEREIDR